MFFDTLWRHYCSPHCFGASSVSPAPPLDRCTQQQPSLIQQLLFSARWVPGAARQRDGDTKGWASSRGESHKLLWWCGQGSFWEDGVFQLGLGEWLEVVWTVEEAKGIHTTSQGGIGLKWPGIWETIVIWYWWRVRYEKGAEGHRRSWTSCCERVTGPHLRQESCLVV